MPNKTIYKSKEGQRQIEQHYENYLKSFPFEVERMYVDTKFGKTHVLVAGPKTGKPIFLFQGGNCVNPMTLSWFPSLIDEYRVYAPDTIGHPGFSDENRISPRDQSFAQWTIELMNHFNIEHCAFIGLSYGAGILLRLATFHPNKIDCAILISPSGIKTGSMLKMTKDILLPLVMFYATSLEKYLNKITNALSDGRMNAMDQKVVGDILKYTKIEKKMPKMTKKGELSKYNSPTLIVSGKKDIFFPESKVSKASEKIINHLEFKSYDMGHFPSDEYIVNMNDDIQGFLDKHYK